MSWIKVAAPPQAPTAASASVPAASNGSRRVRLPSFPNESLAIVSSVAIRRPSMPRKSLSSNAAVHLPSGRAGTQARILQMECEFEDVLGRFCYKNQCNTVTTTGESRVTRRVNPQSLICGWISIAD
jgi:hypothetical protein